MGVGTPCPIRTHSDRQEKGRGGWGIRLGLQKLDIFNGCHEFMVPNFKKVQYEKMLNDSITTTYKNGNDNIHNKINTDEKKLMKGKDILNRMLKNECFITLKNHKSNVKNNPKVRLINPCEK